MPEPFERDNMVEGPDPVETWEPGTLFAAVEEAALEVELVFEDQAVFVDPIIICPPNVSDEALDALGARREQLRSLLHGVQVHRCPGCEPGKLYLMDRIHVVDADGACLVCCQPTT